MAEKILGFRIFCGTFKLDVLLLLSTGRDSFVHFLFTIVYYFYRFLNILFEYINILDCISILLFVSDK